MRCFRIHQNADFGLMYFSQVEEDLYFPYITYVHSTGVKLPSGKLLTEILNGTN